MRPIEHRVTGITLVFAIIMAFLVIAGTARSGLADDRLGPILSGVKRNYASLPALTIPYERDVVTKSMALLDESIRSDVATGRIHFQPPHFLRLEQESPKVEWVISNGQTLWWYIPDKKEVYQYPSRKLGQELKMLSDVFQGLKEVEDGFKVEITAFAKEGRHRLKLTPEPPWSEIDFIELTVSQEDFSILEVTLHNYLGGFTRFALGNPTIRKGFDRDFFIFVAPEGVRVILDRGD